MICKIKRIVSVMLAVLMLALLILVPTIQVSAETTFTNGDYVYAVGDAEGTCLVYSYLGEDSVISLPETVAGRRVIGICDECFSNSNISAVTIPESYISIGDSAFYNCDNITEVVLPSGLQYLGAMAFAMCDSLKNVDMGNCDLITEIPYAVFSGDSLLDNVVLPNVVKTIGDYAFYGCAFNSLTLPPVVETVGGYAFADNSQLSNVDIPNSVNKLGAHTFDGDTALLELFIPDSVQKIEAYCFDENTHITCYSGSYAESYCLNKGVNYTAIDKKLGDADLNGVVNILDVTCIQKFKIGENTISTYRAEELADVNHDEEITIRDATLIQMYLAKIITEF